MEQVRKRTLVFVSCRFIALFVFVFTDMGVAGYAFVSLILVVHTSRFHFMCLFFKVDASVQLELSFGAGIVASQPCFSPRSAQKTPYESATVP